jgi:hypothetical protein
MSTHVVEPSYPSGWGQHAAASELCEMLSTLGLAQHRIARLFDVGSRTVRCWNAGDRRVPCGVGIVLRLAAGAVTVDQVEQAAVSIPARTNGSAKPGPPTPLLVAPAPATLADPGLTTAEKVVALAPGTCCWPCGAPGHPDFHFCGSPVARRPYCEHHRAMAYAAPLTGSGHGARSGRVAHGWRSPTRKRLSTRALTRVSTRLSTDPVDGSVDKPVDESVVAQAQDFRAL